MDWTWDEPTAAVARDFPLDRLSDSPAEQSPGRRFNPARWARHLPPDPDWPRAELCSSPRSILECFSAGSDAEALALTVSWGTMWRQSRAICGDRELSFIESQLSCAAETISETGSIDRAWDLLTISAPCGLGWSPVMTSKVLHFLCRALGHEDDPPVPIDNAVILRRLWPAFSKSAEGFRPPPWSGDGFTSYARYMTAILVWRERLGWSTTEVEASLFRAYRKV